MDTEKLQKDLINTLETLRIRDAAVLYDEVIHFFANSQKTPVDNNLLKNLLSKLEEKKVIFTDEEGFVALSSDLKKFVKERLLLDEETRERTRQAQKILKPLGRFKFIKYIGVYGDSPLGRIKKGKPAKLLVVVEPGTLNVSKFLIKNYLKLRFSLKKFNIEEIFEAKNFTWNAKNPTNGIKLLNLSTIVNKDQTYEQIIGTNNWIFELFPNYPLEKVSWSFRVSKDASDYRPGWLTRKLEAWLD